MTLSITQSTSTSDAVRPRRRRAPARRQNLVGWLFVAPFGIVFVTMLILPLGYSLYLSLFQKRLIGDTRLVWFDNYVKAFHDPSFRAGVSFVIRFSLVLIPVQMAISLGIALILDLIVNRFAR